jgi:hypothetical protein
MPVFTNGLYGGITSPVMRLTDKICFAAYQEAFDIELWCGDPDFQNVVKLDIEPGYESKPQDLFVYNGELYFMATIPFYGRTVVKSDGTAQGTVPLIGLGLNSFSAARLTGYTPFNGYLYFLASRLGPQDRTFLMRTNGIAVVSGTQDQVRGPGVKIGPNPARQSLEVRLPSDFGPETHLSIFDLQGRLVGTHSFSGPTASVDLQRLSPGLYIFQLTGPGWTQTEKVQVMR